MCESCESLCDFDGAKYRMYYQQLRKYSGDDMQIIFPIIAGQFTKTVSQTIPPPKMFHDVYENQKQKLGWVTGILDRQIL